MVEAVSGSGGGSRVAAAVATAADSGARTTNSARQLMERRVQEIQRQVGEGSRQSTRQGPVLDRGVSFQLKPEINMIQTLVFDRKEGDVIREIPSSERLQFVEQFRKQLEQNIGRRLDVQV